jgi:hypothetical protein
VIDTAHVLTRKPVVRDLKRKMLQDFAVAASVLKIATDNKNLLEKLIPVWFQR